MLTSETKNNKHQVNISINMKLRIPSIICRVIKVCLLHVPSLLPQQLILCLTKLLNSVLIILLQPSFVVFFMLVNGSVTTNYQTITFTFYVIINLWLNHASIYAKQVLNTHYLHINLPFRNVNFTIIISRSIGFLEIL